MDKTFYNTKQIVSVRIVEEFENNDYEIVLDYSILRNFILRKKRELVVKSKWHETYSLKSFENRTSCFIEDGKVFTKASVTVRFSNDDYEKKYFESNVKAHQFVEHLKRLLGQEIIYI